MYERCRGEAGKGQIMKDMVDDLKNISISGNQMTVLQRWGGVTERGRPVGVLLPRSKPGIDKLSL